MALAKDYSKSASPNQLWLEERERVPPNLRGLNAAMAQFLSDKPESDGVTQAWDLADVAPLPKLGFAAGALKLPWTRMRAALEGAKPLEMGRQELWDLLSRLSPEIEKKALRVSGAQLLDEFGMSVANSGLARHAKITNAPSPNLYAGKLNHPFYGDVLGAFNPKKNEIAISSSLEKDLIPGVMAHEVQHAIDSAMGSRGSRPELVVPSRMANANLQEFVDRWVEMHPGHGKYPDKKLAQRLRVAQGNNGFRGIAPGLMQDLRSFQHFGDPFYSEIDIPMNHMARAELALGNADINPAWLNDFTRKGMNEYKSPMVSVPADMPRKKPRRYGLWSGVAAAAGTQVPGDSPPQRRRTAPRPLPPPIDLDYEVER